MVKARRDNRLIDAIEAIDPVVFEGNVWRLVRDGRDPLAVEMGDMTIALRRIHALAMQVEPLA